MASTQFNGARLWRRLFPMLAGAMLLACGGGGTAVDPRQQPSALSADCALITQVQLQVTGVRIARGGQQLFRDLAAPRTIDLMAAGTGLMQALGLPPLGSGDLAQLRLTTSGGTIRFASGASADLKAPGGVTVRADTAVPAGALADLVMPAFDACSALRRAGSSGQWLVTGDVMAQPRTLPFSTTQLVGGHLRPLPGGGDVIVQADGSGGFVVQRFDAYGNALGDPLAITLPLGTGASLPALTPLASGYLATWLGPTLDPQVPLAARYPLFAQLLDASGSPVAAPTQVALTTPFTSRIVPASVPQAAALPDGGAALVWVQLRSGSLDVFMQLFSATAPVGSPRQVNTTTSQGMPTVTGLANGNVLVVWGVGSLDARVLAPDGSAGAQQAIAPDAAAFVPVSVSPAPDGGAAVAWESQVGSGVVFVERLGPDGAPVSGPQAVTGLPAPDAGGQHNPSVGVLADGSAVVAWIEGPAQVWARRFAADGTPMGAAQVVSGSHSGSTFVVPLAWGGFLIEASTSGGVVATLFDAQGLEG